MSRVFHFISAVQAGGAEVVAIDIAVGLSSLFSETHVVAVRPPKFGTSVDFRNEFTKQISDAGIKLHEIGNRFFPLSSPVQVQKFLGRMNVNKYDLIHIHSDIPEFSLSSTFVLPEAAIIRTIHNTVFWPGRSQLARFVEWRLTSSTRVAVSKAALVAHDEFRNRLGLRQAEAGVVVYNGVDAPDSSLLKDSSQLAWKSGVLNILFVGRLDSQKGPDVLLAAIGLMPARLRAALHVHIVGSGKLKMSLEKTVNSEALPVTFYGALPNAKNSMPQADLIVVPSRFEGFGLSAAEAILAKKRILASNCTGLSEIFPLGHQDLVDPGDPSSLASKLGPICQRFLHGYSLPHDESLFNRASKMFNKSAMLNGYQTVYRKVRDK